MAAAAAFWSAQHRACSQSPRSGWRQGGRCCSGDVGQRAGKSGCDLRVPYVGKTRTTSLDLISCLCRLGWFSSRGRKDFSLVLPWFWTPQRQLIISSILAQRGPTMSCCKKVGPKQSAAIYKNIDLKFFENFKDRGRYLDAHFIASSSASSQNRVCTDWLCGGSPPKPNQAWRRTSERTKSGKRMPVQLGLFQSTSKNWPPRMPRPRWAPQQPLTACPGLTR